MGNLRIQRKKKPSKSESLSSIFIKFSLVRQEGLEPPTSGSGGQRRPFDESLFLYTLSHFHFSRVRFGCESVDEKCHKTEIYEYM